MAIRKFSQSLDNGDTMGAILAINEVDINRPYQGINGHTPLTYATKVGNMSVVTALIGKNADVNARGGQKGMSPLHIAVYLENKDIVRMLINIRADINALDNLGRLPLHHAVISGAEDAVRMLLSAGSLVDVPDIEYRWTPLHLAAYYGYTEIVELLIRHGATTHMKDINGAVPEDIAKSKSYEGVTSVLQQT